MFKPFEYCLVCDRLKIDCVCNMIDEDNIYDTNDTIDETHKESAYS